MPIPRAAGTAGGNRPATPPELIGVEQFAELLGVSARHVRRLVDAGKCPPPVRLGKCLRFSRRAADQWITDGCPNCRRRPGGAR
jgi:excisionase family DNA binding protein